MSDSPPSPAPTWVLVQLKPNATAIALRNLARQGFSTFAPMHETTWRRAGRFATKRALLFPGYVFVRLDTALGGWRTLNNTLGVARLVCFANHPARVPADLITALQARCDAAGLLQVADLAKGDQVTITQGPLSGFVGTIERLDADQRIWVLLEMMGQRTCIQVPAGTGQVGLRRAL